MANYRDQFISSVKEVRTFSSNMGFQNAKTAFEHSAISIAGVTLNTPNNSKFYDRSSLVLTKESITQNGKTYPIELISDNLRPETIRFFTDGMIAYHNYKILVDKAKAFYDVRDIALSENPTMNIADLVGEALVAEGQSINSVKLDVAFLQKNSLGTLNQQIVGFENAIFHIFGAYHEDDKQIANFINSICEAVPEANRDAMRQTIIQCFKNASERAAACANIDEGVKILIDGFSGVGFKDFHQRATQIYNDEREKYSRIDEYEQANEADLRTIALNSRTIERDRSLIASQRSSEEIQQDIEIQRRKRETLRSRITADQRALSDIDRHSSALDRLTLHRVRFKYSSQIRENETELAATDEKMALLQKEYGIVSGTLVDEFGNKVALTTTPTEITIDGKTRQVVNPDALKKEISEIEKVSNALRSKVIERDAYLMCAYSLMHYAIDFRHLGAEVVEGLQKIENIGNLPGDLDVNAEQIKQALSIANNVTRLMAQDGLDGKTQIVDMRTAISEKIFDINEKYVSKDGKENPYDCKELMKEMIKLCADKNLPDGQPNPFFGRIDEIRERMGIAVADQAQVRAANRINPIENSMKKMDPKLLDFNVRKKLLDYYKKQKLIPVTNIRFSNKRYVLEDEYQPKSAMPNIDTPVPSPQESVKPVNFCKEMSKALERELEALGGSINKSNVKDCHNAQFNKHYYEILSHVKSSFDHYAENPDNFEEYQNGLMKKLQEGKTLSEKDFLMIRFCPKFNPMIREYVRMIDEANESGDPRRIEQLRVKGKEQVGNSIFPDPLNQGIKAAILTIHKLEPEGKVPANFEFDVKSMTFDFIEAFTKNMEEVGDQFRTILDDPEFQKYKDFLTIELVDGQLTITSSTYQGKDGKLYSSNPYDQQKLSDKALTLSQASSKHMNGTSVYVLEGDELKKISIDEFRASPRSTEELYEVRPGEYAMKSQMEEINKLALNAAQKTQSKIPNVKVNIVPINAVESTSEGTAESVSESGEPLGDGE